MSEQLSFLDPETPEPVRLCGVDEVGRGPLIGPVVAAAVILDPDRPISGLADSKKLTERKREALAEEIREKALAWAIAEASAREIDRLNILQATFLAMQRAVAQLSITPQHVYVDGNRAPAFGVPATAVVKGDQKVPAVSAASILAKVHRDQWMIDLDRQFPGYGFAAHKGYPTAAHLQALATLGILDEYRRTYRPVRQILEAGKA